MIDDNKVKEFFAKDNIISDNANSVFDNFISKIQEEESTKSIKDCQNLTDNITNFKSKKKQSSFYKFRRFLTVAASFAVIFIGLNSYAHTKGYENIFFLIKDFTISKIENNPDEIFSDKDIIISYKSFQITDSIEMQINEFQVKDNKAKLYLLVKELDENNDTPFFYKIYNDQNLVLFNGTSQKENNKNIYTEILTLSNYTENTQKLKLEIYNKNNILLKTVTIDLDEKVIEAKTENIELKKISQIQLNEFLKEETKKCYTDKELKDKEIIILKIYDIYYSDAKFVVQYLFMKPSEEDFENDTVENSNIYTNKIEFNVDSNGIYKVLNIENPEIL